MTRIPHYKEVVIMSFECEHCGNKNTGYQQGQCQEKGVRYQLQVKEEADLCRQVVKSDVATISVPELELEIPPSEKGGELWICSLSLAVYIPTYLPTYLSIIPLQSLEALTLVLYCT